MNIYPCTIETNKKSGKKKLNKEKEKNTINGTNKLKLHRERNSLSEIFVLSYFESNKFAQNQSTLINQILTISEEKYQIFELDPVVKESKLLPMLSNIRVQPKGQRIKQETREDEIFPWRKPISEKKILQERLT